VSATRFLLIAITMAWFAFAIDRALWLRSVIVEGMDWRPNLKGRAIGVLVLVLVFACANLVATVFV
jgi:hypothetical protein